MIMEKLTKCFCDILPLTATVRNCISATDGCLLSRHGSFLSFLTNTVPLQPPRLSSGGSLTVNLTLVILRLRLKR